MTLGAPLADDRASGVASPPAAARRAARRWRVSRRDRAGYLFMLPAVVLVACVSVLPVFFAVRLSLHQTQYATLGRFVGLANFAALLRDPAFLRSLSTSALYVLPSLALAVPLGLGLAVLLNQPVRARVVFRTLIILPWVVSQTVTALLWLWLLNYDFGPLNFAIRALRGAAVDFLTPDLALPTLVGVNVWRSYPFPTIMLLAALQTVPHELYEAVAIDGASAAGAFRWVTLPWIRSTLLITLIALTIEYFNMVTLIYVLTGGGPLGLTETVSLRVFNTAFTYWRLGSATAMGMVIFALNAVFSWLYLRTLRREAG